MVAASGWLRHILKRLLWQSDQKPTEEGWQGGCIYSWGREVRQTT